MNDTQKNEYYFAIKHVSDKNIILKNYAAYIVIGKYEDLFPLETKEMLKAMKITFKGVPC